tara:strand:- start:1333 stop:1827 length:495 start_codon:yes stop_codon:yes gene_type:complete
MVYWFKRKYRQVKRVLDFLPIIWRGFDFDYQYAIELFKHQLIRTEKFMSSPNTVTVNANSRAKKIKTAIELLDKVYDEEYGSEYHEQMKSIYGNNVLEWVFEEIEDTGRGDRPYYLTYEYEKWENKDEVKETFDKLFKQSQDKQKRAEKLVWEFISHNIRGWWD